jgi:serpin B
MIPTIQDRINPLAAMYLLDAIYFKANWTSKFDPSSTRQMAFTMPDGNSENRMMMHSNMKADYCSNDYYQMLYLPYGNQSYGMYILLPDRDKTTDDIIERLTAQELKLMIQNMRNCNVDILLPRFTTSSHHMLNDPLSAMGMPLAFSEEDADFPFMAQDHNLFVYQMLQRARIEVNERGTKAAAVTVAETRNRSAAAMTNHVNFHAVRPFVYFIVERSTQAIFFMGTYCGEEQ